MPRKRKFVIELYQIRICLLLIFIQKRSLSGAPKCTARVFRTHSELRCLRNFEPEPLVRRLLVANYRFAEKDRFSSKFLSIFFALIHYHLSIPCNLNSIKSRTKGGRSFLNFARILCSEDDKREIY